MKGLKPKQFPKQASTEKKANAVHYHKHHKEEKDFVLHWNHQEDKEIKLMSSFQLTHKNN